MKLKIPTSIGLTARSLVILTVVIWSFFGIISKLLSDIKIEVVITISLWASALFNYFYLKISYPKANLFLRSKKLILTSICGYAIYWIFYIACIDSYTQISVPVILNYTWPLFTGVLTIFMFKRQKIEALSFLSLTMGFIGILVLQSEGSLSNLAFGESYYGLFTGVLCGLAYGLYSSQASSLNKSQIPQYLFTGTFISAIIMSIYTFSVYGINTLDLTTYEWALAFFIGFIFDTTGYIFWTKAQSKAVEEKIDITKVVSLANYLPVFSFILLALFYKEERVIIFQTYFIIAVILITTASVLPHFKIKIKKV